MSALLTIFSRLGVTEGLTFRTVHEEGVGFLIEPNPAPTRQQPQALRIVRPSNPRASGKWIPKPVHNGWPIAENAPSKQEAA